jgi:hypothetical protein
VVFVVRFCSTPDGDDDALPLLNFASRCPSTTAFTGLLQIANIASQSINAHLDLSGCFAVVEVRFTSP